MKGLYPRLGFMDDRTKARVKAVRRYVENSTGDAEEKFIALEMLRLLEGGEPGIMDAATADEVEAKSFNDRPISSASIKPIRPA